MKFCGCITLLTLASALPNEYISKKNQAKLENLSREGLQKGAEQAKYLVDAYKVRDFDGELLDVAGLTKQAIKQGGSKTGELIEVARRIVDNNKNEVKHYSVSSLTCH